MASLDGESTNSCSLYWMSQSSKDRVRKYGLPSSARVGTWMASPSMMCMHGMLTSRCPSAVTVMAASNSMKSPAWSECILRASGSTSSMMRPSPPDVPSTSWLLYSDLMCTFTPLATEEVPAAAS